MILRSVFSILSIFLIFPNYSKSTRFWKLFGFSNRRQFFLFFSLSLLPFIIGHGCHGDDIDHEPATIPTQLKQDQGNIDGLKATKE